MNDGLKEKLQVIERERSANNDPSHDYEHLRRVTNLAEKIGKSINADLEIIIPAAIFHDIIVYRKDSPESKNETKESAEFAGKILAEMTDYPKGKIEKVKTCILECYFSKGIIPETTESRALQDADKLEATGAISIMRTFSSGGQMNRKFYDPEDPFREKTDADHFSASLDLFYKRLLIVEDRLHTELARAIAKRRTRFLKDFLDEFRQELVESSVVN